MVIFGAPPCASSFRGLWNHDLPFPALPQNHHHLELGFHKLALQPETGKPLKYLHGASELLVRRCLRATSKSWNALDFPEAGDR